MSTAVSALDANNAALSVESANIANVNTIGYKTGQANFSTLLAASLGSADISSAGVTANMSQNVSEQGLLQSTNSPTDLAISGNGFFVVSNTATAPGSSQALYFTRAGSFTPDANGDLRNSAGYYLLGWALDSTGNIPSDRNDMSAVNINALSGKANPTTSILYKANLQSSTAVTSGYTAGDMYLGNVTPDFQRTVNIYDAQGGTQPLQFSFVKTAANTWAYEINYQGDVANIGGATSNPLYEGTMTFNPDGTLANADTSVSPASGSISLTLPWDLTASGLDPQTISLNMGTVDGSDGFTQFDSPSSQISSTVDGALFGSLTGVSIDTEGYVTAQFSNGLTQKIYKLPVASFANPDGLAAVSGNAYSTSNDSGTPTIAEANTGGAGTIHSKSLEGSTVDLANEFTNLITTQRAYAASARIVTTASTMLDQLLQVVH
jgi:flagellar hook protein FlgE